MVFSVRPIYRHLATSGHPENGSKLNFAMEPSRLLAVELWLSFLYASYNGAMVVYLTELMPPLVRTSAFSIAYSLAAAIFGGFTPAICTYLIQVNGDRAIPRVWLSFAAATSLAATLLAGGRQAGDQPAFRRAPPDALIAPR